MTGIVLKNNKYPWGVILALFLLACAVKWYYLAQQHYYVRLDGVALDSFDLAETVTFKKLLSLIFLVRTHTWNGISPFFTSLLYALTYKAFGYQPQTVLIMGIVVGSLLAPLYFLAIRALVNTEVALVASMILIWMTDYVYQSIALKTILLGALFITGALVLAVRYYQGGKAVYLYLSGILLSMSVFCRYENALILPVFVGYEFLFDKRRNFFLKIFYGLLCASSSLWILYCGYRYAGDPFHVMQRQTAEAFRSQNFVSISWRAAFSVAWSLWQRLLPPFLWLTSVAGMVLMIGRSKLKAVWCFSAALVFPLFLIYKIKAGTLDHTEDYFFPLSILALPLALEFVRRLFAGIGRRKVWGPIWLGGISLFFILSFHQANQGPLNGKWYYPSHHVLFTEALREIPTIEALYFDVAVNNVGVPAQDVLVRLGRHPLKYQWYQPEIQPPERSYYLVTLESPLKGAVRKNAVKVRDFKEFGFEGVGLYRVTRSGTDT